MRKNKLAASAIAAALCISVLTGCTIRDFDPTVFMARQTNEGTYTDSENGNEQQKESNEDKDSGLPAIKVLGVNPLEINDTAMNELSKLARVSVEIIAQDSDKEFIFAKKAGELLASEETNGLVAVCDESNAEELQFLLELTTSSEKPVVFVKSEAEIYNGVIKAAENKGEIKTGDIEKKVHIDISHVSEFPQVAVVYDWTCMDTAFLEYVFDSYDGIIIAAAGNGAFSQNTADFVAESKRKPVIVRASRDNNGNVIKGEGFNDEENHTIAAGTLTPAKARILLMAALAVNKDDAGIWQIFEKYSDGV
ncbi:MAG: hypothetical protein Q4F11_08240 [Eubacteriales bacterium]|nr:hypothetical protein [Eubacteriales bacterium]